MAVQAVLQSWKEISRYVGRTERTLQRWEQEFGFPVHRPSGKSRSAVMALTREINEWARGKPSLALIRQTARIKRARLVADPANQSASRTPASKTSLSNRGAPRTRHSGFAEPLLESAGRTPAVHKRAVRDGKENASVEASPSKATKPVPNARADGSTKIL